MSDRAGIETILGLLEEAFRGAGESQALLPNIRTVPDDAWRALPPGAARSVESIAIHVGACKIMYDDDAFGDGTLRFATPDVEPWVKGEAPWGEVVTRWPHIQQGFR